ncbi:hypothetical protein KRM28CT15_17160 [Krasilnikovia sp. M28-CT-15]
MPINGTRTSHEVIAARAPGHTGFRATSIGYRADMDLVLWIIAVILVVAGILALFRRQLLWGIVLIIVGLLVGPGGVSLFT